MLKDKLKSIVKSRKLKLNDVFDVFGVSSKTAMTNKLTFNRTSVVEMIKLCDRLDYELVVRDKNGEIVVAFDMFDVVE